MAKLFQKHRHKNAALHTSRLKIMMLGIFCLVPVAKWNSVLRFLQASLVNEKKVSDITIDQLKLRSHSYFTVRVGNKHNAKYVGGFNLFGKTFGDHEQDILISIEY